MIVAKMKFPAGISQRLEESDFTSTQERIQADQPSRLLPFDAHPDEDKTSITLPMNFTDYLTLLEMDRSSHSRG